MMKLQAVQTESNKYFSIIFLFCIQTINMSHLH